MNRDPLTASTWKGRLLIEYFTEDCKYPIYSIDNIEEQHVKRIEEEVKPRRYQMFCEIGSGLALPETKEYKIKVKIGN